MDPSRIDRPSHPATPPDPLEVPPGTPPDVEAALEAMDRLQAERRARPLTCFLAPTRAKSFVEPRPPLDSVAMDALARAYDRAGSAGVAEAFRARPSIIHDLAARRPAELESAFAAAFARTGVARSPGAATYAVTEHVAMLVRGRIVGDAQRRIAASVERARALRDALPERLEALRHAAPGSREAVLARELAIRGNAGDLERARGTVERALEGLARLADLITSPTRWSNADFPLAAVRAAATLGIATPSPGTIAEDAVLDGGCALAVREWIDAHRPDLEDVSDLVSGLGRPPWAIAARIAVEAGLAVHHVALGEHRALVEAGRSLGL